jgi:hypothetical protein
LDLSLTHRSVGGKSTTQEKSVVKPLRPDENLILNLQPIAEGTSR